MTQTATTKTLYTGGKLFNGVDAPVDGHAVLVAGDKIERVAPVAEFQGFDGAVVDTAGGTVMPGMIDCHVHLCMGAEGDPGVVAERLLPGQVVMRALSRAQESLAGGITAVRDCGGRDYLELAVRDACNAGELLGLTIRASGRMVCMTGGHGNRFGRVADGIDEVVKAVREQIHAGADVVKIMATGGVMTPGVNPEDAHYSAEEMAAGIAEGKRFHKRTASHAQGTEGILNAVRGGIHSIEHGIFMSEKCVQEMLERGTYLVPTIAALRNILAMKEHGVPDYVIEKTERVRDAHERSIKMFYGAGGKIAMGTDAGTPYNKHGANAQELAFMVDIGVAPLDALRFATSGAADLLDLPHEGNLAEGGWADLVIVDGDPAEDIAMAADRTNHRLVVKRGLPANARTLRAGASARQALAAF